MRLYNQRRRADPQKTSLIHLYRATAHGMEVRSLHNKRRYQDTKQLRKYRRSGTEPDRKFNYEAQCRDPLDIDHKITWDYRSATWRLHLTNPPVPLEDYLTVHNLTLAMADEGNPDDYEKERTQLYMTAVKVWNALDTSNRRRIRLPANMDEDANRQRSSTTLRVAKTKSSATASSQASIWV